MNKSENKSILAAAEMDLVPKPNKECSTSHSKLMLINTKSDYQRLP